MEEEEEDELALAGGRQRWGRWEAIAGCDRDVPAGQGRAEGHGLGDVLLRGGAASSRGPAGSRSPGPAPLPSLPSPLPAAAP